MTKLAVCRYVGVAAVLASGGLSGCTPSQATTDVVEPVTPSTAAPVASAAPPVATATAPTPAAPTSSSTRPLKVKGPVSLGPQDVPHPPSPTQLRRMRERFRACYVEGLKQHEDLAGSATLVAKIDADGKVRSVGGGGGGKIGPIVPCLKKAVVDVKFPPQGDSGVVISIPITFTKSP